LALLVRACVTGVCAHTCGVWDAVWAPLGSVGPGRIVAFPLDMAMCEARQASQSCAEGRRSLHGDMQPLCVCVVCQCVVCDPCSLSSLFLLSPAL
jgi:hypothetical protein